MIGFEPNAVVDIFYIKSFQERRIVKTILYNNYLQ